MLISQDENDKRVLKTISFRADKKIVEEFKALCKKHKIKQITVIENAMKKAIQELKDLEKNNDR